MATVGLVLGAGGVTGQAYHSGVLAALENDLGWDARTADVIVGTSAGSITGALLRSGIRATDLAAWTLRASLSPQSDTLPDLLGEQIQEFEPYGTSHWLRRPRLPGLEMLQRAVIRPWHFRPVAAALALLAPGRHDVTEQLTALRELEGRSWPEQDLWLCAVRRRDGRRVAFGSPGAPNVPLHLAVAASCAVPGYFVPVEIDGHTYVDGGAHSPTNAAILRQQSLDLVIVISPMSGPAPLVPTNVFEASRRHAARLAASEVRALRAKGTAVVVFRPGRAEQAVMGDNFLARNHVDEIIRESFFTAGTYAAQPEVRALLSVLDNHHRGGAVPPGQVTLPRR